MTIYTEASLGQWAFHDCTVHGHVVVPELAQDRFDLDWLAWWLPPSGGDRHFSFLVSPTTLVFEDASELEVVRPWRDFGFTAFDLARAAVSARAGEATRRWQYELPGRPRPSCVLL